MRVSDTDYFAHHGVKGMKWGIRKERPSSGRSSKGSGSEARSTVSRKTAKPDTRSEDRKRYDEIRSKKRHEMSDEELKAVIGRMNMERQYRQLDEDLYRPGKKFAKGALKTLGNMGVAAVGGYMVKSGGSGIAKLGAKAAKPIARRVAARAVARGITRAVRRS